MSVPWYDSGGVEIRVGHVLDVLAELPAGSIQTCVTSPPYYGLRAYNTAPVIWGGSPDCDHTLEATASGKVLTGGTGTASAKQVSNAGSQYGNAWVEQGERQTGRNDPDRFERLLLPRGAGGALIPCGGQSSAPRQIASQGATCTRCGAWRGELGSEPTPELYVEHIVEVFRAARRVLHNSGTI